MDQNDSNPKHPVYRYEPGELERTRKNLGQIDKDEALKMAKLLGGEVGYEKSAPVDEAALRKVRTAIQTKDLRNGERKKRRHSDEKKDTNVPVSGNTENSLSSVSDSLPVVKTESKQNTLPALTSKERALMDKLMMAPDYRIKPNYGIFNFIMSMTKTGQEKIAPSFISITLKAYILRLQNFQTRVGELLKFAPESYRNKVVSNDDTRFRFLKVINNWNMNEIESKYQNLEKQSNAVTITMMIPFIREIYKVLLTVYFLGDSKIAEILNLINKDLNVYPDVKKDKVGTIIKELGSEWMYIYNRVIRGLYPLLLRMSSSEYFDYSTFFTKQVPKIFAFLGITKFDVILPSKKPAIDIEENETKESQKTKEQLETEKKQQAEKKREADLVASSLKVLDRLFPGAGWLQIAEFPDMYPFYQPLYHFQDGFNLLSPENPLQITIVLIKIIEDLFEGCRNIGFSDENKNNHGENMMDVLNDWSAYREILFDKLYVPYLKDFTNQLYMHRDFFANQYGKRLISNMQWHTFYNFLPHLKFEQLLLEKPSNESKMRPLSLRTSYLLSELRRLTVAADTALKTGNQLQEIPRMFEPYHFDIPNVVSQRLDILLGAKRHKENTKATNANLLKYALSAVAVLNWWISDKDSPAYSVHKIPPCRLEKDNTPIFSVTERKDQNALFVRSIKAAAANNAASNNSTQKT